MTVRRSLLIVAFTRLLVSGVVLGFGITAVTDDDYNRLTIALAFAETPDFSPFNGSWLPLPALFYGAGFTIFGPSLVAAHILGVALGLGATLLFWDAARRVGASIFQSTVASVLITLVPQIAVHGALTVPELPASALAFWAVAASRVGVQQHPRIALACVAVSAATLCRYEMWPIAMIVAIQAARHRSVLARFSLPLVASSGIAAWFAYWYFATGNPLGFTQSVAEYRLALGQGQEDLWWKVARFPTLAIASAPELTAFLLVAVWFNRSASDRTRLLRALGLYAPASICLLIFLVVSDVRNTMATHHLERPLLFLFLLRGLLAGIACSQLFSSKVDHPFFLAAAVAAVAGGLASRPLMPHYHWYHSRPEEVALGQKIRTEIPGTAKVAIEAANGYGHFAIIAGFGYPSRASLLLKDDPVLRKRVLPDFEWAAAARRSVETDRASWVVAPRGREDGLAGWAVVRLRTPTYVLAKVAVPAG